MSSSIDSREERQRETKQNEVELTRTSLHSHLPPPTHQIRTEASNSSLLRSYNDSYHAEKSVIRVENSVSSEEGGDANEEGVDEAAGRDRGSGDKVGVGLHEVGELSEGEERNERRNASS